jgi:hypothetical protein
MLANRVYRHIGADYTAHGWGQRLGIAHELHMQQRDSWNFIFKGAGGTL